MINQSPRLKNSILLAGLFVLALLPRLAALRRYITPDELIWVFRSVQFRQAIITRQWADTLVSGHPGVTTAWLGVLGVQVQLLFHQVDQAVYDWITHMAFFMPDNMAAFSQLALFLPTTRLLVAVVNSIGVVAIYELTRPIFNHRSAIFAALILALDPFVAGLSGLLHVDALMATFATVSLLSLLNSIRVENSVRGRSLFALLSGVMAAFAILTKTPALLLLPLTGLFLFLTLIRGSDSGGNGRFWQILILAFFWLAGLCLTILVAYPAVWSAPKEVFTLLSGNAGRHIVSALRPIFFLGRVSYDPGPLFYPVALALRLSPVVFVGLFLAMWYWLRHDHRREWHSIATTLLLLWIVLFIVGVSFAAKKFDRYALAVIPELTLFAGVAWMKFADRQPVWGRFLGPGLIAVQAIFLIINFPYPLAGYNPLLGGSRAAEKILPIGWGEAISASGRWLAEQPGAEKKTAVSGIASSLAPFFPGKTLLSGEDNRSQADYIVLSASGRQLDPKGHEMTTDDLTLLHTVHYGGLDQAWIYAQPNPEKSDMTLTELDNPISFDNRVSMLATKVAINENKLDFYAQWQLGNGGENGRHNLKLTLRDEAGNKWTEREIALVNETYFYPEHWPPGPTAPIRYTLDLPPGLPPGTYKIELSLFDLESGAQLPIYFSDSVFQGVVYTHRNIKIPTIVPGDWSLPVATDHSWLADRLVLLGHSLLPEAMTNGETAVLVFYWQAKKALPDDVSIVLSLGDGVSVEYPISRYDSGQWGIGDRIREKIRFMIPTEIEAGTYPLTLNVSGETAVTLGQIEIISSNRLFALPEGIQIPLDYHFDNIASLRGLDWDTAAIKPGGTVKLTLYWQTDGQSDELISTFVHLVGPGGINVAQDDRWPGNLPSDSWANGQVIVDKYTIVLPPNAPAGNYQVAVGLYTAVDGVRLTAVDAEGLAMPDNRVILPVPLTVGIEDD